MLRYLLLQQGATIVAFRALIATIVALNLPSQILSWTKTARGRVDTQAHTQGSKHAQGPHVQPHIQHTGYKQAQGPHTTLGLIYIYTRLTPPAATAAVAFTIAATLSEPRIFAVTGVGVTAVGRSRVL